MQTKIECYDEIMTTEQAWQEAVQVSLQHKAETNAFFEAKKPTEIIFAGCTSPFHAGMVASAFWKSETGIPARAVPSSELVMFPSIYYSGLKSKPVLIALSRSGKTSETIWAMEDFERRYPGRSVLIGCNPQGRLAELASLKIFLPDSAEKSIPQTRSLGSMLISALVMAAFQSGNLEAIEMLESAPAKASDILKKSESTIKELFENKRYHNLFILGGGFFYGIALEAGLKCMEMSTTDAFSYTFMESRHGPRSLIDENSLVVGLYSRNGLHYEAQVMDELTQKHKATTLAITPTSRWETGKVTASIGLDNDWPDNLSGLLYLPPVQLAAYYCAVSKGLNPDVARLHTLYVEIEKF
jgi:glucosamine--fructose-6-phosphate aminotransferase (isomerizing)